MPILSAELAPRRGAGRAIERGQRGRHRSRARRSRPPRRAGASSAAQRRRGRGVARRGGDRGERREVARDRRLQPRLAAAPRPRARSSADSGSSVRWSVEPRLGQRPALAEPRHHVAAPEDRDRAADVGRQREGVVGIGDQRGGAARQFDAQPPLGGRHQPLHVGMARRDVGDEAEAGQMPDRLVGDAHLAVGGDRHRQHARRRACRDRAAAPRCADRRSAGSAARAARRRASPRARACARPNARDRPASRRGARYRPRSAPPRSGRRSSRHRPARCRAAPARRRTRARGCGRRPRSDGGRCGRRGGCAARRRSCGNRAGRTRPTAARHRLRRARGRDDVGLAGEPLEHGEVDRLGRGAQPGQRRPAPRGWRSARSALPKSGVPQRQ